jgi:LPXTG-site transpeptidase (sortase) family protein
VNRPLKNKLRKLVVFLTLFAGASLFFYLILNGGAFFKRIRYWVFLNSPFVSYDLREGEILKLASAASLPAGSDYQLFLPRTQTQAPIVSPAGPGKQSILAAMEDGVALYPGSVEPGKSGRAVILGHSSRASWYRGNYATVFSLLPQMAVGDDLFVVGLGKKYTYEVFDKKILDPNDTNALLATSAEYAEITLITCYPIGSASSRNIIRAKLIAAEDI